MSRLTSANRLEGTRIFRSSGTVCVVTLDTWRGAHSLHHLKISPCIPFHTHRRLSRLVDRSNTCQTLPGKPSMSPVRPRDGAAHDVEEVVNGVGGELGGVGKGEVRGAGNILE